MADKHDKIAVAMSGGVDSSVAAALMVEKYGKENVFGVTMKLFCYGETSVKEKNCCSTDAISDAGGVCKQLGIPHYVVNLEKEFEVEIIGDFVSEYELGNTPNPCVRCNSVIKFKLLLEKVLALGAVKLVTGHYARIAEDEDGFKLLRGRDESKDQSYFLYNLSQNQLSHILFPLGEITKTETRKIAEKFNLKTAKKIESQDICFVTTTAQDFLSQRAARKPGKIVNKGGKVLGCHEGIPLYTIGQRRGLGGGFSEPMYVVGLDLEKNEVTVGQESDLFESKMIVTDVGWVRGAPKLPAELAVKIRYNSEPGMAVIEEVSDRLRVKFKVPQRAITPGQTAVFYSNDVVLGGGKILST